jgi:dephospho-CoA kinase
MILVGLTGSIGMGKSEASRMFRRLGVPVYDADAAVHRVMGPGGSAVAAVDAAFPGVVQDGRIDRQALGQRVLGDKAALRQLEAIVHPRVRQEQIKFLRNASRRRVRVVVLDIPLLFETGGERRCDVAAVVSAPALVQALRVLRRPGMTPERLANTLSHQMPDREKRRRADVVLPTGLGRRVTLDRIRKLLDGLRKRRGVNWPPAPRRGRLKLNGRSWGI